MQIYSQESRGKLITERTSRCWSPRRPLEPPEASASGQSWLTMANKAICVQQWWNRAFYCMHVNGWARNLKLVRVCLHKRRKRSHRATIDYLKVLRVPKTIVGMRIDCVCNPKAAKLRNGDHIAPFQMKPSQRTFGNHKKIQSSYKNDHTPDSELRLIRPIAFESASQTASPTASARWAVGVFLVHTIIKAILFQIERVIKVNWPLCTLHFQMVSSFL